MVYIVLGIGCTEIIIAQYGVRACAEWRSDVNGRTLF